jgi:hypothetical protein
MSPHLAFEKPLLPTVQTSTLTNGEILTTSALAALVPSAYDSLMSTTITTAVNSLSFTNIPQTYAHLELRLYTRSAAVTTLENVFMRFNGDAGSNYTSSYIEGYATTAANSTGGFSNSVMLTAKTVGAGTAATQAFAPAVILIADYTSTAKAKTARTFSGYESADVNSSIFFTTETWTGTAAINSITLYVSGAVNWSVGSVFSLYGIRG